jgi:S-formylglutathione hydrolase FrmB
MRRDRRSFLGLLATSPVWASACVREAGGVSPEIDTLTVRYGNQDVRCLFHQVNAGRGQAPLAILLLHGAHADATQWTDIGLIDTLDQLGRLHADRSLVAIAPDLASPPRAESMITDAILPTIVQRFQPELTAISGISMGGAMALDLATAMPTVFNSLGLHSPAVRLDAPTDRFEWPCWIDVGEGDPLSDAVTQTAQLLRDSGIAVSEHHWPGGHDRRYWRSHLHDYLSFHLSAGRPTAS